MTSPTPPHFPQSHTGELSFDVEAVRARFPALFRRVNGVRPIYFDNPGGTQVPWRVVEAMNRTLVNANANLGAAYETSHDAERIVQDARRAMADLLNAPSGDNIAFGANMTTLTFALSRAIGRTLSPGDEIIVTYLEHDGNVAPWLTLAEDLDLKVRWADVHADKDCTLDMEHLESLVNERTKVIACTHASNALGTITDAERVVELAHSVGALAFVDAVQYAPHGPIDVQTLDCDFLVCSPYKFFGPHMGVLYGKLEQMESLPAYKVRPAPEHSPDRWETGTQSHESIAGVAATVEYLDWVGERFGEDFHVRFPNFEGRRLRLKVGYTAITAYEQFLSSTMLEGLAQVDGVKVFGITDIERLDERVPTFGFRLEGMSPREVAWAMNEEHIYIWDGDYYAVAIMERLGLMDKGGMVRVGLVHYNTIAEVNRFLERLEHIAHAR